MQGFFRIGKSCSKAQFCDPTSGNFTWLFGQSPSSIAHANIIYKTYPALNPHVIVDKDPFLYVIIYYIYIHCMAEFLKWEAPNSLSFSGRLVMFLIGKASVISGLLWDTHLPSLIITLFRAWAGLWSTWWPFSAHSFPVFPNRHIMRLSENSLPHAVQWLIIMSLLDASPQLVNGFQS